MAVVVVVENPLLGRQLQGLLTLVVVEAVGMLSMARLAALAYVLFDTLALKKAVAGQLLQQADSHTTPSQLLALLLLKRKRT
jgi:hypothetical protein